MLSGYSDLDTIIGAVNEGAISKFLTKPWNSQVLRDCIANAFSRKEEADENRRLAHQARDNDEKWQTAGEELLALLARKWE
jgi:FixJ family two-component response regulator